MSVGRLRNLEILDTIADAVIQTTGTLGSIVLGKVRIFGGVGGVGRVLGLAVSRGEGLHFFLVSLNRRTIER